MHDGDLAHVVAHAKGRGRLRYVLAGSLGVSSSLRVEPEVQMGVAELVATGFSFALLSGSQHSRGVAPASIEVQDLPDGHPGVLADGQEFSAGGFYPFELGDAEEVPGWVFDVIGVYGLVQLELLAAVFEALGVVQRKPALSKLRLRPRHGDDKLIERAG